MVVHMANLSTNSDVSKEWVGSELGGASTSTPVGIRACSTGVGGSRNFVTQVASAAVNTHESSKTRIRLAPTEILPHRPGQVRVITNTTRDAQQSNCSAEMSDEHRQQISRLINDCFVPHNEKYPGYEQIWGGTVPMFDLWKRGVQPFDALRRQIRLLPNTPTSMLFRSSAINSMKNQPRDVIEAFIQRAYDCGIDVFTNFDAHNDWRNHEIVAEAVHRAGGHYQAALSWATWQADPSVFNVAAAVDFFRVCANQLGAHSLYIKDPSGVLTPAMAGMLARAVKEAFPHLPLVFHTHYQSGYAYMSYLQAVQNGANGIECSAGFADGAGQPYAGAMLKALADLGYDVGYEGSLDQALNCIERINSACKKIWPLYVRFPPGALASKDAAALAHAAAASILRTPDLSVDRSGIAGGQRSILDRELIDCGQANLIPMVDSEVTIVRALGGKVCQVTPVADAYAREALRLLRIGKWSSDMMIKSPTIPATKGVPSPDGVVSEDELNTIGRLSEGFISVLIGEGGVIPEPVHAPLRYAALVQRGRDFVQSLRQRSISKGIRNDLNFLDDLYKAVPHVATIMLHLAQPWLLRERLSTVIARLDQLARLKEDPIQAKLLQLQFDFAATRFGESTEDGRKLANLILSTASVGTGRPVVPTIDARIDELERERQALYHTLTQLLGEEAGKIAIEQAKAETKRGMPGINPSLRPVPTTRDSRLAASAEVAYRIALFGGDIERYQQVVGSEFSYALASKLRFDPFLGVPASDVTVAVNAILAEVLEVLPAGVISALNASLLSTKDIWDLIARCSCITATIRHVDLLEPALEKARLELDRLDELHILGIREDQREYEDLIILQACFAETAVPKLFYNFLRQYREKPQAFPTLYIGQNRIAAITVEKQPPHFPSLKDTLGPVPQRLEEHRYVLHAIQKPYRNGASQNSMEQIFNECVAIRRDLLELQNRLACQRLIRQQLSERSSKLTSASAEAEASLEECPPIPIVPLQEATLGQIAERALKLGSELGKRVDELVTKLLEDEKLWIDVAQSATPAQRTSLLKILINDLITRQVAIRV